MVSINKGVGRKGTNHGFVTGNSTDLRKSCHKKTGLFKMEKKRTSHSNVTKSLNKVRKKPQGTVMSEQDRRLKPPTHQWTILDVKICDQAKGRIPITWKNTGKKTYFYSEAFLIGSRIFWKESLLGERKRGEKKKR